MMDLIIFLAAVGAIWIVVLLTYRKYDLKQRGFSLHPGLLMWRTERGLSFIDRIANRFKRWFMGYGSVVACIGFLLMGFVFVNLILNAIILYTRPAVFLPGVRFVLPGVLPGLTLPIWLVVIGVVLVIHEFFHGFLLRCQKLKAKSIGVLFLFFIPGAFVEPDEKELMRTKPGKRIRMFAAGPMSNVLISLLFLGLLLVFVVPKPGVYVYGVGENYPLENYAENLIGARILAIDNMPVQTLGDYHSFITKTSPGENHVLVTDRGEYRVELAESDNHGIFGILPASALPRHRFLHPVTILTMTVGIIITGGFFTPVLYTALIPWWAVSLLQWLFALNLGVGLFNLLPAKPLDGGYMLEAAIERRAKKETARQVVKVLSYTVLVLIILNLIPNVWRMVG
jgi:membrane-associated protease RseP (regulator of RpoE activity)